MDKIPNYIIVSIANEIQHDIDRISFILVCKKSWECRESILFKSFDSTKIQHGQIRIQKSKWPMKSFQTAFNNSFPRVVSVGGGSEIDCLPLSKSITDLMVEITTKDPLPSNWLPTSVKRLTLKVKAVGKNAIPPSVEELAFEPYTRLPNSDTIIPDTVKTLTIHDVDEVKAGTLPAGLKNLVVSIDFHGKIHDPLPSQLESLMYYPSIPSIHGVPLILTSAIPKTLTKLHMSGMMVDVFSGMLSEFIYLTDLELLGYSILKQGDLPKNLKKLNIIRLQNKMETTALPIHLKRFQFGFDDYQKDILLEDITKYLPSGLKKLKVSSSYESNLYGETLPVGLKVLHVSGHIIVHSDLPKDLEKFTNLGVKRGEYNENSFPTKLRHLILNGHFIFKKGTLPDGLEYLEVGGDSFSKIYQEALPQSLKVLKLGSLFNPFTGLIDCALPNQLKELEVGHIGYRSPSAKPVPIEVNNPLLSYPNSLISLKTHLNGLFTITSTFGDNLYKLDIQGDLEQLPSIFSNTKMLRNVKHLILRLYKQATKLNFEPIQHIPTVEIVMERMENLLINTRQLSPTRFLIFTNPGFRCGIIDKSKLVKKEITVSNTVTLVFNK